MLRSIVPLKLDNELELEQELTDMLARANGKVAKPIPPSIRRNASLHSGAKFSKLLVINKVVPKRNVKFTEYHCLCDCGTVEIVRAVNLRSGRSTMCRKCFNLKHKAVTNDNA